MTLNDWINYSKIKCQIDKNILRIEGFKDFLILEEKNGKIITNEDSVKPEDYYFILNEDEEELVEINDNLGYFIFKWGSRFYYSPLLENKIKDQYNSAIYKVEFNPFLNLGDLDEENVNFVNLGIHSGYELLNGSGETENWVNKAKFFKQKSLGIIDKNTLASSLSFQIDCEKNDVKPIFGATYSVAYNYDSKKDIQEIFNLILYVKNKTGWKNLLKINKRVNVDFDEFIPEEEILRFGDGLICVIPNKDSYFNYLIGSEDFNDRYTLYEEFFDKVYLQLDFNEFENDEEDIKNLENTKKLFENHNKKDFVYIPDTYYIEKIDSNVKSVLNKISSVASIDSKDQYMKTFFDIINQSKGLFKDDKINLLFDALDNTNKIADQCDFKIKTGEHRLPKFPCDDSLKLYEDLIEQGLKDRIFPKVKSKKKIKEYKDRIEEENNVIVNAGFIDYFLILWDVVTWSRNNGILVGSGRGSVGGSLIAYLLNIIDIDPIEYDLLFERFLNKTRVSGERAKSADAMPDIDLDFEGQSRGKVKKYIESKYGTDRVCSIGTFTRLKVKSALKDFGKVYGMDFQVMNRATKAIPDKIKSNWRDIFDNAFVKNDLKKFVKENSNLCEDIIGVLNQPKAGSIHASALVIVPAKDEEGNKMTVFDWMPVKKVDDQLVSEWEGKFTDRAGFLKEDILGLSQLDKFKSILKEIEINTGQVIDLNEIPTNFRPVFDYFTKGWNEDVFQFGTSGLKSYSKKVKPDSIEDLISMNALYRPGPMESSAHEDFADIKHGKKKPVFDEKMKEVTRKTNGLYIFQEQVMKALVVGGLTLAEADNARTAIKKFDNKKMKEFKKKFVSGYSKIIKSKSEKEANKVWDKLVAFSSYGFNRSHSAAYSLMGYWCQFLKVCYPLEFWCASLNFSDEKIEIPNRISEIKKINTTLEKEINVMPPDINKSDIRFTSDPDSNSIYWSLIKVKNAGSVAVNEILNERNKNGEFFSFKEFLSRVKKSKVNKRVVTHLIISGAFDNLEFEAGDEIIGKEYSKRLDFIKRYHKLLGQEYEDNHKNANKNWYWIVKQKELTGFGQINFKELLKSKVRNKKVLNNFVFAENFQDLRVNKKAFADNRMVSIVGNLINLNKRKYKKDSNKYLYTFEIKSNNTVISGISFFDDVKDLEEDLIEHENNKDLVVIFGELYYDDYRDENAIKVIEKSKVIKIG